MGILTLIFESMISLGKNKVRTALSMLGIVIGVGAVIVLVAMAQATKTRVEDEIARLGDDWMFIGYWGMPVGGVRKGDQERKPFQTKMEADEIMKQCSAVRAATPSNRITVQVKSSYSNYLASVYGAYPAFHDIRRWDVIAGRKLDQSDEDSLNPVCCVGQSAARELFGSINPVGEFITIKNSRFKIVGLLAFKGQQDSRDLDDIILVPFMVAQRKIAGNERSGTLMAATQHGVDPSIAQAQITSLLRQLHGLREGEPNDFRIFAQSENAETKAAASEEFQWLLRMIASVSLVVGGIGIMNIMLVSVTERTREIGLRMAIGANGFDVMLQFLIEAIMLCAIGGIIGMLSGWLFTFLMTQQGYETEISPVVAGIALGCAFLTGILSGFYPAWRASRLDPIEALRYE
ncbi:MAG: ABC transporter permease [Planctomycetes bacterium]|nr:ABC transporter permease [Planctomycetota bacterium]